MRMHNPPDIEFKRDKGFERADRIARVLDQIHKAGARAEETGPRDPGAGVREDQTRDSQMTEGEGHDTGDGDE
jgi:hypothetical protein